MIILGIESSSTVASVAIVEDGVLKGEFTINHKLQHAKSLLPMLSHMMELLDLKTEALDAVAVSEGPGSFTGLRIGSATAKGIAHAHNLPIISVPTLDVLAASVTIPDAFVGVVVHARADEVYYSLYKTHIVDGVNQPEIIKPLNDYSINELVDLLIKEKRGDTLYLVGDGADVFKEALSAVEGGKNFTNVINFKLSAKNVALLGVRRYYNGDTLHYNEQSPYYHKKSQAERELEEKMKP